MLNKHLQSVIGILININLCNTFLVTFLIFAYIETLCSNVKINRSPEIQIYGRHSSVLFEMVSVYHFFMGMEFCKVNYLRDSNTFYQSFYTQSSHTKTLLLTNVLRCLGARLRRSRTDSLLAVLTTYKEGCYPFWKVRRRCRAAPLFRPSFFARDRKYYVALNKWVIRGNICLCTSATVLKASETQVKYLRQLTRSPVRDFSFCKGVPLDRPVDYSRVLFHPVVPAKPPLTCIFTGDFGILSVILSKLFVRETSEHRANKQFSKRSPLFPSSYIYCFCFLFFIFIFFFFFFTSRFIVILEFIQQREERKLEKL